MRGRSSSKRWTRRRWRAWPAPACPFLENLAAQEGYHPLYGAAALVVLSAPGGLDEKGFNMANVSCAAENMLLAAAGLGLGSCFLMGPMAAFSDPALRARLELPGATSPW